ncbi:MAG: ribosomal protein S18-alanine N-acetyltransferase [Gammaproteobacteria bacterium]|jgi:ribosomal-protein-alanine N-acetyltransferase
MATTETKSDLNIRPMQMQDVEVIAQIENSAYFAPWPRAAFSASIGIYPAFVLEKNQEIIGYALFSAVKDEAHILNLVIKPSLQHHGYGRLLLRFILEAMLQNQVKSISLEVARNNVAALHLYQSLGFSQQGLRKEYYQTPNGREDALILVYKPSYN